MLRRLSIEEAAQAIADGEALVFPTETSYGLACLASSAEAVDKVMRAKGRPGGKPLPVLVPSVEFIRRQGLETPLIILAQHFWPGPLTLVVPAFPGLPAAVTADTNMVGVRMSSHPVAQALVKAVGAPIVATSANRSGEKATASPQECDDAELDWVCGLVEGGHVSGSASTVVGLVGGDLRIHREGPISEDKLREVWDPSRTHP